MTMVIISCASFRSSLPSLYAFPKLLQKPLHSGFPMILNTSLKYSQHFFMTAPTSSSFCKYSMNYSRASLKLVGTGSYTYHEDIGNTLLLFTFLLLGGKGYCAFWVKALGLTEGLYAAPRPTYLCSSITGWDEAWECTFFTCSTKLYRRVSLSSSSEVISILGSGIRPTYLSIKADAYFLSFSAMIAYLDTSEFFLGGVNSFFLEIGRIAIDPSSSKNMCWSSIVIPECIMTHYKAMWVYLLSSSRSFLKSIWVSTMSLVSWASNSMRWGSAVGRSWRPWMAARTKAHSYLKIPTLLVLPSCHHLTSWH